MLKDNRGFAITTIIFGILILFMLLLVSLLGVLSNYLNSLDKLMDSTNGTRNSAIMKPICTRKNSIAEIRVDYIKPTSTDIGERINCLENVKSGLYCFGSASETECSNNCEYIPRKRVCN